MALSEIQERLRAKVAEIPYRVLRDPVMPEDHNLQTEAIQIQVEFNDGAIIEFGNLGNRLSVVEADVSDLKTRVTDLETEVAYKVDKRGDVMTGNLTIKKPTPELILEGEEVDGRKVSIREDAGWVEFYDYELADVLVGIDMTTGDIQTKGGIACEDARTFNVIPRVDAAFDLGSSEFRFRNLFLSGVGDIRFLSVYRLQSGLIPDTDATFSLGSSTLRFRDLYLSGIAYMNKLSTEYVAGTLKPDTDAYYSLGTAAYRWLNLHLSGGASIGGDVNCEGSVIAGVRVYSYGPVRAAGNRFLATDSPTGEFLYAGLQSRTSDGYDVFWCPTEYDGAITSAYGQIGTETYYWWAFVSNYSIYKSSYTFACDPALADTPVEAAFKSFAEARRFIEEEGLKPLYHMPLVFDKQAKRYRVRCPVCGELFNTIDERTHPEHWPEFKRRYFRETSKLVDALCVTVVELAKRVEALEVKLARLSEALR